MVVGYSGQLERERLIPQNELTLRWRIEVAAAFLTSLMSHAENCADDEAKLEVWGKARAKIEKQKMVEFMTNMTIQRAKEILQQGHA